MQEISLTPHVRGDSWQGFAEIAVTLNGDPLDLSGASARMQIRRSKGSPTVLLEWSTGDDTISFTEPSEGKFAIAGRVIDLPPGEVVFDIELTLASGRVLTVAGGSWLIVGDVTRN
jgi:hypothetical protein